MPHYLQIRQFLGLDTSDHIIERFDALNEKIISKYYRISLSLLTLVSLGIFLTIETIESLLITELGITFSLYLNWIISPKRYGSLRPLERFFNSTIGRTIYKRESNELKKIKMDLSEYIQINEKTLTSKNNQIHILEFLHPYCTFPTSSAQWSLHSEYKFLEQAFEKNNLEDVVFALFYIDRSSSKFYNLKNIHCDTFTENTIYFNANNKEFSLENTLEKKDLNRIEKIQLKCANLKQNKALSTEHKVNLENIIKESIPQAKNSLGNIKRERQHIALEQYNQKPPHQLFEDTLGIIENYLNELENQLELKAIKALEINRVANHHLYKNKQSP